MMPLKDSQLGYRKNESCQQFIVPCGFKVRTTEKITPDWVITSNHCITGYCEGFQRKNCQSAVEQAYSVLRREMILTICRTFSLRLIAFSLKKLVLGSSKIHQY